ncbi:MAG: L-histidine N(alpha)-methyltransferase [Gemmatimonadaceae bacterium]|nr:L-histidine N(alpha)-methyltransferase [Gemmatimonadaceae bacterium]
MSEPTERRRTGRIKRDELLRDVQEGLAKQQKELSSKYFYDERGSELFEEITRLPEYYPTEAERELLHECAPALVSDLQLCTLVELGAGSASKTRVILDAMRDSGLGKAYIPVDVSGDFLEGVAEQLRIEYPTLQIVPAVADITHDFVLPPRNAPTVIAFLGSTIGNFGREDTIDLLSRCAQLLEPDDRFLLGCDLRKAVETLEAAYNDSQGITAEFNLNILHVINTELGANFDVSRFRHRAFYNADSHRIEMHLIAAEPQTVTIPGIGDVHFLEGESIHTEVSYKYNREAIETLFVPSGLVLEQWMTGRRNMFALAVGRKKV